MVFLRKLGVYAGLATLVGLAGITSAEESVAATADSPVGLSTPTTGSPDLVSVPDFDRLICRVGDTLCERPVRLRPLVATAYGELARETGTLREEGQWKWPPTDGRPATFLAGSVRPNWLADLPDELPTHVHSTAARLIDLDGSNRKQQLDAVVATADELLATLDQLDEATTAATQREQLRRMRVEALYRRARAIGYRNLPGVVTAFRDAPANDAAYLAAVERLRRDQTLDHPDYFLVAIRAERVRGRPAEALVLLQRYTRLGQRYLFDKKRGDLYEELGWSDMLRLQRTFNRVRWGVDESAARGDEP